MIPLPVVLVGLGLVILVVSLWYVLGARNGKQTLLALSNTKKDEEKEEEEEEANKTFCIASCRRDGEALCAGSCRRDAESGGLRDTLQEEVKRLKRDIKLMEGKLEPRLSKAVRNIQYSNARCPGIHFFLDHENFYHAMMLKRALRHKMFGGNGECERLALLGDAVLNAFVVDILQSKNVYDLASVGELTEKKKQYVSNEALANLDKRLHISLALKREYGQTDDRNLSVKVLGTLVEALIGAAFIIYRGDRELMRDIVRRLMASPEEFAVPFRKYRVSELDNWSYEGFLESKDNCCGGSPFDLINYTPH